MANKITYKKYVVELLDALARRMKRKRRLAISSEIDSFIVLYYIILYYIILYLIGYFIRLSS